MPISFTLLRRLLALVLPVMALAFAAPATLAQQVVQPEGYHTPAVSEDFYRSIRFNWTDSLGQTHTSDLTEPASDPAHIVALLTEVYTNPAVPGFVYDHAADSIADGREPWATVPYDPCTLPPYSMEPDRVIQRPAEGATALIVELNDNFDHGIFGSLTNVEQWAGEALASVKSVQLISKQMYVSADEDQSTNPGFLFNVEATLDKFYIITKGCNRPLGSGYPLFYNMFEEFSPTNNGPMYNAFEQMDSGRQFPVDHNCSTVIGQNHIVVMPPAGENHEHAVNLMFYLPDYRFLGETRFKQEGDNVHEHYSFYAADHQPYFFFNKISAKIDGDVVTVSPDENNAEAAPHTAWVPVTWVSTYKDITRSKVPEQFYIYRVVNDTFDANPVPAEEIVVKKQPNTYLYEDGSITRAADNTVCIFVKEHRETFSRNVRYVVIGRRAGSDFSFVESNEVEAVIPGYDVVEALNIVIDGTPRSRYDVYAEKNIYSNSISLTESASANGDRLLAGHIVVPSHEGAGTIFELRRTAQGVTGSKLIAEMEIIGMEDKVWDYGRQGVHVYDAVIHYRDGITPDGTARFKSVMNIDDPSKDPLQPIIALDGKNGVLANFVDNFEVSTERGDHPQGYTYQMSFRAANATNNEKTLSNTVSTVIPVRELYVGYVPYTIDEVLADVDVDNRLAINPIGVAFQTKKNTSISGYTVTNVTKGTVVAHAIRTPSGIFERVVYDDMGKADDRLNSTTSAGFFGKLPFRLNSSVDINDEFALTLEYTNGNTYGNVRSRLTAIPAPEIIDNPIRYLVSYGDNHIYNGQLIWTSEDLAVAPWPAFYEQQPEYTVFDYNVWSNSSDNDDFDLIYSPGGVVPMNLLDDEDTAVKTVSYNFTGHYATFTNPVETNHIVRLYAKAPQELLIDFDNVTEGFVISETDSQASISQTGPIISGIDSIDADSPESDACYFDLMGRPVDRALLTPGIYIRVIGNRSEKITIL